MDTEVLKQGETAEAVQAAPLTPAEAARIAEEKHLAREAMLEASKPLTEQEIVTQYNNGKLDMKKGTLLDLDEKGAIVESDSKTAPLIAFSTGGETMEVVPNPKANQESGEKATSYLFGIKLKSNERIQKIVSPAMIKHSGRNYMFDKLNAAQDRGQVEVKAA